MTATAAVDGGLAENALDHLLTHPRTYGLDALLAPAVLHLVEQSEGSDLPVVDRLRRQVIAHFQQRIAKTLEPPRDWRRDSRVTCDCTYCRDLSRFLAARDQGTWKLKAAETERRHVEQSIQRDRCDVNCHTEKKGRPYTLVCNKNQASYLRRVEQRGKDLETLGRLATESGT